MSKHHARLDPRRVRRVRRLIFDAAGWRCASCGRAGPRLELDHKIPIHRGGDPWALDNLQCLCGGRDGCHAKKTAGENRRQLTDDETAWRRLVAQRMGNMR